MATKVVLKMIQATADDADLGIRAGQAIFEGAGLLGVFDRDSKIMTLHELSPVLSVPLAKLALDPDKGAAAGFASAMGLRQQAQPSEDWIPDAWAGGGWRARLVSVGSPALEVSPEEVTAPNALAGLLSR